MPPPLRRDAQSKALQTTEFADINDEAHAKPVHRCRGGERPAARVCRVTGYINQQVRFELPPPRTEWNGKFIHMGSGRHGGSFCLASALLHLCGYACQIADCF